MIQESLDYLSTNFSYILNQIGIHLYISTLGVVITFFIGFPLGIFLSNHQKSEFFVTNLINIFQTVPSIALLTILLMFMGLGQRTVLAAVVVYSLLPIVKNTTVGLKNVDPIYIENARSIGMSKFQTLWIVMIPLAAPIILAGVRTALVMAVGVTAIGSFVGAGGLGDIILRGVNITNGSPVIIIGSGLCVLIVIGVDVLFKWIIGTSEE